MRGDLRDAHSLVPALAGVDTVVTTANALLRIMAGDKDLTLSAVDVDGNRKLVRAAEDAGVRRYLFLSAAGLDHGMGRHAPLAAAKLATEELPRHGPMEAVMVRPDMFQVWLAPLGGSTQRTARRWSTAGETPRTAMSPWTTSPLSSPIWPLRSGCRRSWSSGDLRR